MECRKGKQQAPPTGKTKARQEPWIEHCDVLLDNDEIRGIGDCTKERQQNPEHGIESGIGIGLQCISGFLSGFFYTEKFFAENK
jgi:hypothetical protein